jgi:uncharacterized protein DUF4388
VSAGLSGKLSDFGIADVFQLIGQQRKTGALELKSGSVRAQLTFDRGQVVSAGISTGRAKELDPLVDRLVRCGHLTRERADEAISTARASAQTVARTLVARGWLDGATVRAALDLVTRDAIFDVLRWQSGTFDFHAQSVDHDRDPTELLGAEQILMDGLRMVDEWHSFAQLVPSEDTVFARSEDSVAPVGGESARVLALIDGRLSARRVIDLARVSTFDGMRVLSELRRAGAIRAVVSEDAPPLRRSLRSVSLGGAALRGLVAALVPLALLGGVTWQIAAAPGPAMVADRKIERSSLASLRDDYAMRAVRNALEAYRLAHGRWPGDLDELAREGLVAPETLASLGGRAYYSLDREHGPVFLAPERS